MRLARAMRLSILIWIGASSGPLAAATTPAKLNGTLTAGGDVDPSFRISADSSHVLYVADQATDQIFELYNVPSAGGQPLKLNGSLVNGGCPRARNSVPTATGCFTSPTKWHCPTNALRGKFFRPGRETGMTDFPNSGLEKLREWGYDAIGYEIADALQNWGDRLKVQSQIPIIESWLNGQCEVHAHVLATLRGKASPLEYHCINFRCGVVEVEFSNFIR